MDIKEQIAVMQHYANGGKVECKRLKVSQDTFQGCLNPSWSWADFDYRIKKEPRKFKFWYHPKSGAFSSYDNGLGSTYFKSADWELVEATENV